MKQEEAKNLYFRLKCFVSHYESFFKLFEDVDSDYCCGGCVHKCATCKDDECSKTPDCLYYSCEDCGASIKRCITTQLNNSKQLYQSVESITLGDCARFVADRKSFKSFPRCKKFSQIFDDYICDAIEFCSSYLLSKNVIDANDHKNNLVHVHIIHKFEVKVLDVLFENVKAGCAADTVDDDDEEEEESPNIDPVQKDQEYTLTKEDILKDWKCEDIWKLLKKGLVNKVKALYENEPYLAELTDSDDNCLYERAAKTNNCAMMSLLISNNFNLQLDDNYSTLVSFTAASSGSLDVLKLLFETNNASLNDKDYNKNTLLHVAVVNKQIDVVRFLLEMDGIDVNAKTERGYVPLYYAIDKEAPTIIQMLLERDDINLGYIGCLISPLHWACRENHLEVVKLLIQKHKHDINLNTERYTSEAIHYALENENCDVVRYLLQQEGINLNVKDQYYGIPLLRACRNNFVDIVELMVQVKGVDLNVVDNNGQSALHIACGAIYDKVHIAIAHILLQQKGIDVNIQDCEGNTPLHLALDKRIPKLATMLLKNPSIDVNVKNGEGIPPGGMYQEYKAIEEKLSFVF